MAAAIVPPVGRAASFAEFRIAHRAEHQTAFNRRSVAVGNLLILLSAVPFATRRWRRGVSLALIGGAVLGVGHAVEGTLADAGRDLIQHPLWAIRADVTLMYEVIARR